MHSVVSVGGFGCGASLHRFVEMMGEGEAVSVGCFRAICLAPQLVCGCSTRAPLAFFLAWGGWRQRGGCVGGGSAAASRNSALWCGVPHLSTRRGSLSSAAVSLPGLGGRNVGQNLATAYEQGHTSGRWDPECRSLKRTRLQRELLGRRVPWTRWTAWTGGQCCTAPYLRGMWRQCGFLTEKTAPNVFELSPAPAAARD